MGSDAKPFSLPIEMQDYLVARNTPPDHHLKSLIDIAAGMESGGMRLGTEAGTFLQILTWAVNPRFAVEVGTFIGYSSLCIASQLQPGAKLLCCDVSERWTAIARQYWAQAGVDDRIQLVIAPAAETLAALAPDQTVDLAFVDADKGGYINYYEMLLPRLSERGVIGFDNTMWGGQVLDDNDDTADTVAIRAFNDHVAADDRTRNVTVPIGDGVTLVSRR